MNQLFFFPPPPPPPPPFLSPLPPARAHRPPRSGRSVPTWPAGSCCCSSRWPTRTTSCAASSVLGGYPQGGSAFDSAVTWLIATFVDGRAFPMFGLLFGYGVAQIVAPADRDRSGLPGCCCGGAAPVLVVVGLARRPAVLRRRHPGGVRRAAVPRRLAGALEGPLAAGRRRAVPRAHRVAQRRLAVDQRRPAGPVDAAAGPERAMVARPGRRGAVHRAARARSASRARSWSGCGRAGGASWSSPSGTARCSASRPSSASRAAVARCPAGRADARRRDRARRAPTRCRCSARCTTRPACWAASGTPRCSRCSPSGSAPAGRRGDRAIAATGQRSMTCYLMQSVVWAVVFTPFLLDLSGRLTVTATALLAHRPPGRRPWSWPTGCAGPATAARSRCWSAGSPTAGRAHPVTSGNRPPARRGRPAAPARPR